MFSFSSYRLLIILLHSMLCSKSLHVRLWNIKNNFSRCFSQLPHHIETSESVISDVRKVVQAALVNSFGGEYSTVDPLICLAKASHGDYQSNVCMSLAKALKSSPRDVATKLVSKLVDNTEIIEKAEIAGPGFINLHLSQQYIKERLFKKLADKSNRHGIKEIGQRKRIVVDFSSPNIAKEMHVGHLRSTIIGDCISRVHEFLGYDVLRLNHVGDWGTQFGMLIRHLKDCQPELEEECESSSDKRDEVSLQISDLVNFYKAAKVRFDNEAGFQDRARAEVVKLQSNNPHSLKLWQSICAKSREEFQAIYDLLNVTLIERGESFYNPYLPAVLQTLRERDLLQESMGAQCVFLSEVKGGDGQPLPLIVQKSDGGFLYATTDLAAANHRATVERAERIIAVTDSGQAQHFQMVFAVARLAGLVPEQVQLVHVPFGLVLGDDGKKIKTRAGESVKLKELLQEAVRRAQETFQQRGVSAEEVSSAQSLEEKARILGIAAVKYADLSMNRESNYRFSFEKMLSLTGNTAPYMLYAYVRIKGIQRRATAELAASSRDVSSAGAVTASAELLLQESEELALAKHLLKFDEVLLEVADKLYPNKLCDHIFELSQKFNQFYERCPVVKASAEEVRRSRTALCAITADQLKLALNLLGIETVETL